MRLLPIKPFKGTLGYCGPASLKMIFDYFGVKKSEQELARISRATRAHGVGAEGLGRAARALGFKMCVKDGAAFGDIRKYLKRGIPVIVDWFSEDDGHYSVVVGIDKSKIYLQDPEIGRLCSFNLKMFRRVWFDFRRDYLRSKNDLYIRRLIVIYK